MKTIQDRIIDLHGGRHGANLWLAGALDMSPRQVSRIMNDDGDPPAYLVACVEFLEMLDPADWPVRWGK